MATDTTPAKGRPIPKESDVPDACADLRGLGLSLDNAPNSWQGTLAGRASVTPTISDRYVVEGDSTAANNGIEWYWTGSAWIILDQPTWTNLTLGIGWTANGSNDHVAARLVGDRVEMRGSMLTGGSTVSGGVTIATLPAGMVPSKQRSFLGWVDNGGSYIVIPGNIFAGTGHLVLNANVLASSPLWLDGQFFSM